MRFLQKYMKFAIILFPLCFLVLKSVSVWMSRVFMWLLNVFCEKTMKNQSQFGPHIQYFSFTDCVKSFFKMWLQLWTMKTKSNLSPFLLWSFSTVCLPLSCLSFSVSPSLSSFSSMLHDWKVLGLSVRCSLFCRALVAGTVPQKVSPFWLWLLLSAVFVQISLLLLFVSFCLTFISSLCLLAYSCDWLIMGINQSQHWQNWISARVDMCVCISVSVFSVCKLKCVSVCFSHLKTTAKVNWRDEVICICGNNLCDTKVTALSNDPPLTAPAHTLSKTFLHVLLLTHKHKPPTIWWPIS